MEFSFMVFAMNNSLFDEIERQGRAGRPIRSPAPLRVRSGMALPLAVGRKR